VLKWGSWVQAGKFTFSVFRGTGQSCATAGRLGTGQALGALRGAGGQGADAIEACVGPDGPACILHTGTGSGGLDRAKSGTEQPT